MSLAYRAIASTTLVANAESVSFTNLGITKDDICRIEIAALKTTSSNYLYLMINGDTTQTNYHNEFVNMNDTSIACVNQNFPAFAYADVGEETNIICDFMLTTLGYLSWQTNVTRFVTTQASIRQGTFYGCSDVAHANIDSIEIDCGGVGTLAIGTKITIYVLEAEKVADVNITAATTSVTLGSLDISADDAYLLVRDMVCGASATSYQLCVNEDTTLTNYYNVYWNAYDTTIAASKVNDPFAGYLSSIGDRSVAFINISLSRSGRFLANVKENRLLSAGVRGVVLKTKIAKVADVGSIASINLLANKANGMAADSRIRLYKLN